MDGLVRHAVGADPVVGSVLVVAVGMLDSSMALCCIAQTWHVYTCPPCWLSENHPRPDVLDCPNHSEKSQGGCYSSLKQPACSTCACKPHWVCNCAQHLPHSIILATPQRNSTRQPSDAPFSHHDDTLCPQINVGVNTLLKAWHPNAEAYWNNRNNLEYIFNEMIDEQKAYDTVGWASEWGGELMAGACWL